MTVRLVLSTRRPPRLERDWSAALGAAALRPGVACATPRRKPLGKPRPPEGRRYNRAVSRRRVAVGHTTRRLRVLQSLARVNRHGRKGHGQRVRAVAGLVNRMTDARATA